MSMLCCLIRTELHGNLLKIKAICDVIVSSACQHAEPFISPAVACSSQQGPSLIASSVRVGTQQALGAIKEHIQCAGCHQQQPVSSGCHATFKAAAWPQPPNTGGTASEYAAAEGINCLRKGLSLRPQLVHVIRHS